VDLQRDLEFQALDIGLVSIAFDSAEQQAAIQREYGIEVPMGIDADHRVSEAYDVLQWAVASGEPGHTFVLVDRSGDIAWIRDYGAPDLVTRTMYVEPADLTTQLREYVRP
jgi:peroxiredoxin